jgi:hypothetical protein
LGRLAESIFILFISLNQSRDIILYRMINGTYCLPCFALLVLLVAGTKIHFAEQVPVTGTKQSSQADKAGRQTGQAGKQVRQADKAGRQTSQQADKAVRLTRQSG